MGPAKAEDFLRRDHSGVKPFYYYSSKSVFLFASEIKALFAIPEVPRKLNEVMVARYLTTAFEDTSVSFYEDVVRLPPGHCLTVSPEGRSLRGYWSLDPGRELKFSSDEEYAEALREIFIEAVRCRLRSAFPVGSELSGGLDSSSVACTAARVLSEGGKHRLHTFSAIFDNVPECDERPYINAVLDQGGFEPHWVPSDNLNPLGDIERTFWHLEEPFWVPSMFMFLAMFNAAQTSGVRVLLSGQDGDNAVGYGLEHISKLILTGHWIVASREVAGLAAHFRRSRWRIVRNFVIGPHLPQSARNFREFLRRCCGETARIINPSFADQVVFASNQQPDGLRAVAAMRGVLDQWVALTDGVNANGCEQFDKAAARFRIEPRYPFFDRRLLEFCLAIPTSQKLYHGFVRMVMRRAMNGILPETIRWRGGKATATPNFNRALLTFGRNLGQRHSEREYRWIRESPGPSQELFSLYRGGKEGPVRQNLGCGQPRVVAAIRASFGNPGSVGRIRLLYFKNQKEAMKCQLKITRRTNRTYPTSATSRIARQS